MNSVKHLHCAVESSDSDLLAFYLHFIGLIGLDVFANNPPSLTQWPQLSQELKHWSDVGYFRFGVKKQVGCLLLGRFMIVFECVLNCVDADCPSFLAPTDMGV